MIQIILSYQVTKNCFNLIREDIYEESQLNTDNSLSNNDSVFKLISNWALIIAKEKKKWIVIFENWFFWDNYRSFALKRRQLLNCNNTEAQLYTNHEVRNNISI
jgi:hypothetical protein